MFKICYNKSYLFVRKKISFTTISQKRPALHPKASAGGSFVSLLTIFTFYSKSSLFIIYCLKRTQTTIVELSCSLQRTAHKNGETSERLIITVLQTAGTIF